MDGDPFGASSREDQAWLDRNGYPNARQWETYHQTTDALLATAAAAGDEVAKVMLDSRRLITDDKAAYDDLLAAGINGSGFALEMLSAFMAGSSKGDPIKGYALSRVAEMRGNYRLAMGREMMFNKPLDQLERIQAEAEAIAIFKDIDRARKRKGRHGSAVDMRPMGE